MHKGYLTVSIALLTGACAASIPPPRPATATPATAQTVGFRAPSMTNTQGIESILGLKASALTGRFGDARIDLAEGDARKLQFTSDACVLDVYLYPMEANGEPVATHVAARERQGGAAVDRAGCIGEIERTVSRR